MPSQPRMMSRVENGLPAFPPQSHPALSGDVFVPLPDSGPPPGAGKAAQTSEGPGFTDGAGCGRGGQGPPGDADKRGVSKPQPRHCGGPPEQPDPVPTVTATINGPDAVGTEGGGRASSGEQDCSGAFGRVLLAVVIVLFSPIIALGVCMHDLIACNDQEELYT